MAKRLRLWENDPDSKPAPRKSYDTVGRLRAGAQLQGDPVSLKEWRITVDDPNLADRIAEIYGGTPEQWETKGPDKIEIYTTTNSIEVVFDGPGDLSSRMELWSRNNKLMRSCDGVVQSPNSEGISEPCVCPSELAKRKQAARDGLGCQPAIQAFFRLHGLEDAGKLKFQSSSWSLATEVDTAQEALEQTASDYPDVPILATLALEVVSYTPKQGPMAGRLVSYTKPVVSVLGPAAARDI